MTEQVYILSQIWISIVLLLLVGVFVLARQRADRCRVRLRTVRESLFDFMWKNNLDFSNVEYQETRQLINGLLRLTSTVGPISFLILLCRIINEAPSKGPYDDMPEGALKAELQRASNAALEIFVRFLFTEGVFGLCLKTADKTFRWATFAKRAMTMSTQLLTEMAQEFGAQTLSPSQLAVLK